MAEAGAFGANATPDGSDTTAALQSSNC